MTLAILLLAVSTVSLTFQSAALAHLLIQRARGDAERSAGRGYVRTAACRVAAAVIYVAVAVAQFVIRGSLDARVLLLVFAAVQAIWLTNSVLDIRIRRRLRELGR